MANIVVSLVIGLGGLLLQTLFAKPKDQQGARLSDVNVAAVSPGNPIIDLWGTVKLPGQLIWASRLKEHKHEHSQGKGGGSATSTTYTYTVDIAVAVCQGPVYRINRIRANQKILWENPNAKADLAGDFERAYYEEAERLIQDEGVDPSEAAVSGFFFAFNNYSMNEYDLSSEATAKAWIQSHPLSQPVNMDTVAALLNQMLSTLDKDMEYEKTKVRFDFLTLYYGDGAQQPSPLMERYKGVGSVPAYRGVCYFTLEELQLEDFGNAVPQFQVEVQKTDGTVYLHEIVADVLRKSGLNDDEFCVDCTMPIIPVEGFAVTKATNARGILQDLQHVYAFDGRESGYQLQVGWTDKRPIAVVRRKDFGAHMAGDDPPVSEEITRAFDFDLPKRINLSYQEPGRNYSKNTVFALRDIPSIRSNKIDDYDVTIALDRAEAKSRVEAQMALQYMARRTTKVWLPRKYVLIEPGDVIVVPDKKYPTDLYALRCVEQSIGANGLLDMTFVDHAWQNNVDAVSGSDLVVDDDVEPSTPPGSLTYAYMMDVPLLTDDVADDVGFYTILTGSRGGWGGGLLDVDVSYGNDATAYGQTATIEASGANWTQIATGNMLVPHGFVLNALGDARPYTWDRVNKLRVRLLYTDLYFSSAAEADLLFQPINAILVGDEVLQFANAIDKGNGVWELDTFLRGQKGTEWAMAQHTVGERFVRIRNDALRRVTHDQKFIGQGGKYLALSYNQATTDATPFIWANTGRSKMPYAPDVREHWRDGDGNVTIKWYPRARQNNGLINGAEVVLDQPFERYEIDVMAPGGGVAHTLSTTDRFIVIADADLTTWLGSHSGAINCNIYQIGDIVGRGFCAKVTV